MPATRRFRLAAAALILLAAGVYSNTLKFGAAWDDTRFVFQSGATEGLTALPHLFTSPFLTDVPPARSPYRPVTAASYMLDWSLGGGRAMVFHWTNVALHALTTLLVLLLLLRLGGSQLGALVGSAVYAVHPVHVEAVADLAGRSELLAAFFVLCATLAYLGPGPPADSPRSRGSHAGSGPGAARGFLVLVLFALGLWTKENAVVLPGLLVVVEALRTDRAGSVWRRVLARWPLWLGLTGVVGLYMLTRHAVLGTWATYDVAPFIAQLPTRTRVVTAVANWWQFVRLMVFPADLSIDYGPALVMPATVADPRFWIGLAMGAGALVLAAVAYRRARLVSLGIAWFVVALLPTTDLVVPIAQWLAERFFYLPSVGLSMVVAAAGSFPTVAGRRRGAALFVSAAVLVVGGFSVRTWTRNETWRDTSTVASTLIREHPETMRAQWLIGRELLEQGRVQEGLAALDRAIALNPNAIELHLERADWLLRLGHPAQAEGVVRALPAGIHPGRGADLARSLAAQGRWDAADSAIAGALAAFPSDEGLEALSDSLSRARLARSDAPGGG